MRRKNKVHSIKIIQDSISNENQKMLDRLLEVRPTMVINQPKQFNHLDDNLKKKAILESKSLMFTYYSKVYRDRERKQDIIRENVVNIIEKASELHSSDKVYNPETI